MSATTNKITDEVFIKTDPLSAAESSYALPTTKTLSTSRSTSNPSLCPTKSLANGLVKDFAGNSISIVDETTNKYSNTLLVRETDIKILPIWDGSTYSYEIPQLTLTYNSNVGADGSTTNSPTVTYTLVRYQFWSDGSKHNPDTISGTVTPRIYTLVSNTSVNGGTFTNLKSGKTDLSTDGKVKANSRSTTLGCAQIVLRVLATAIVHGKIATSNAAGVTLNANIITNVVPYAISGGQNAYYGSNISAGGSTVYPTGNGGATYTFSSGSLVNDTSGAPSFGGSASYSRTYSEKTDSSNSFSVTSAGAVSASSRGTTIGCARSCTVTSSLVVTYTHPSTITCGGTVTSSALALDTTVTLNANCITSITCTPSLAYSNISAGSTSASPSYRNTNTFYFSSGSNTTTTPAATYGTLSTVSEGFSLSRALNGFTAVNSTTGVLTATSCGTTIGGDRTSGVVTYSIKMRWTPTSTYNCCSTIDSNNGTATATCTLSANRVYSISLSTNSLSYSNIGAGATSATPSVSTGVTYTFASGSTSTTAPSSTYGSLSTSISYSIANKTTNGFTDINTSTGVLTATHRGTTIGCDRTSATVTKSVSCTWTPTSPYSSFGTKTCSGSTTASCTLNKNCITKVECNSNSLSYSTAGPAATSISPTTSDSPKFTFTSGSTSTSVPDTAYGTLSTSRSYAMTTGNGFSINTSNGTVTSTNRCTTTGSGWTSNTIKKTVSYTWTPTSSYNCRGTINGSGETTATASQSANSITSYSKSGSIPSGLTAGESSVTCTGTCVTSYTTTSSSSTCKSTYLLDSIAIESLTYTPSGGSATTTTRFSVSGKVLSHSSMGTNVGRDYVTVVFTYTNGQTEKISTYVDNSRTYGTPVFSGSLTAKDGSISVSATNSYSSGSTATTTDITISSNNTTRMSCSGNTATHSSMGTNVTTDSYTLTANNHGVTNSKSYSITNKIENIVISGSAGAISATNASTAAALNNIAVSNQTNPSVSSITLTFTSESTSSSYTTYGDLDVSYSWQSNQTAFTINNTNALSTTYSVSTRGNTCATTTRSATFTRFVTAKLILKSAYSYSGCPTGEKTVSCTCSASLPANVITGVVIKSGGSAGAISCSGNIVVGGNSSYAISNSTSPTKASSTTLTATFSSGETKDVTATSRLISWSSSNSAFTITSNDVVSTTVSVTSNALNCSTRSSTIYRHVIYYYNGCGTAVNTRPVSSTCTATLVADGIKSKAITSGTAGEITATNATVPAEGGTVSVTSTTGATSATWTRVTYTYNSNLTKVVTPSAMSYSWVWVAPASNNLSPLSSATFSPTNSNITTVTVGSTGTTELAECSRPLNRRATYTITNPCTGASETISYDASIAIRQAANTKSLRTYVSDSSNIPSGKGSSWVGAGGGTAKAHLHYTYTSGSNSSEFDLTSISHTLNISGTGVNGGTTYTLNNNTNSTYSNGTFTVPSLGTTDTNGYNKYTTYTITYNGLTSNAATVSLEANGIVSITPTASIDFNAFAYNSTTAQTQTVTATYIPNYTSGSSGSSTSGTVTSVIGAFTGTETKSSSFSNTYLKGSTSGANVTITPISTNTGISARDAYVYLSITVSTSASGGVTSTISKKVLITLLRLTIGLLVRGQVNSTSYNSSVVIKWGLSASTSAPSVWSSLGTYTLYSTTPVTLTTITAPKNYNGYAFVRVYSGTGTVLATGYFPVKLSSMNTSVTPIATITKTGTSTCSVSCTC